MFWTTLTIQITGAYCQCPLPTHKGRLSIYEPLRHSALQSTGGDRDQTQTVLLTSSTHYCCTISWVSFHYIFIPIVFSAKILALILLSLFLTILLSGYFIIEIFLSSASLLLWTVIFFIILHSVTLLNLFLDSKHFLQGFLGFFLCKTPAYLQDKTVFLSNMKASSFH